MRDIHFLNNLSKLSLLPSAGFLVESQPGVNYYQKIQKLTNQRKRIYFKVCLNSFEERISRENGLKKCIHCRKTFEEDTAAHILLWCDTTEQPFATEHWYLTAKTLPKSDTSFRAFFVGFLSAKECGHEVLKSLTYSPT